MTEIKKNPIGVLERGLLLLSCFTQQSPRLQLRELSALSGLDKATALRALKTLVIWGYLEKSPDGAYSPGPSNLRMAAIFKTTSNFVSRLEAPIGNISRRVELTTSFFVRSNNDRVCLARDFSHQDFRYFIDVGASVPFSEGGAAAKILLAHTEPENAESAKIIEDGFYISRGELNKHFASVATPLFETDGSFLGAITITGMTVDLDDHTLKGFTKIIREEMASMGFFSGQPR
ncbi:MAG: helix-turn-helix domain-containing protein [Rhodobacteraceae bacterium]|nr:helix-turn-helix domain-containing protein [Paracoccaceae bacterium]